MRLRWGEFRLLPCHKTDDGGRERASRESPEWVFSRRLCSSTLSPDVHLDVNSNGHRTSGSLLSPPISVQFLTPKNFSLSRW